MKEGAPVGAPSFCRSRQPGLLLCFHHDQRCAFSLLGEHLLLARAAEFDRRFRLGHDSGGGGLDHDQAAFGQTLLQIDRLNNWRGNGRSCDLDHFCTFRHVDRKHCFRGDFNGRYLNFGDSGGDFLGDRLGLDDWRSRNFDRGCYRCFSLGAGFRGRNDYGLSSSACMPNCPLLRYRFEPCTPKGRAAEVHPRPRGGETDPTKPRRHPWSRHGPDEPSGRLLDAQPSPKPILMFDANGVLTSHTSMRRSSGLHIARPGTPHLRRLKVGDL